MLRSYDACVGHGSCIKHTAWGDENLVKSQSVNSLVVTESILNKYFSN